MMTLLDFLIVVGILLAVIATPFLFVAWSNYLSQRPGKRVFPIKSVLFFVLPLFFAALAYGSGTLVAECQAAEFLRSASTKSIVSVDGSLVENPEEIVKTLKSFEHIPAHHSSPGHTFQIDISDPPHDLRLWIARDSSDPREYWVFVPSRSKLAFRANLRKDIGHVKTSVFDSY